MHGLLNSSGEVTPVFAPQADFTYVRGINNLGQIIGTYNPLQSWQGFIETDGAFVNIDVPGSEGSTTPNAVNDLGQVVGTYWDTIGAHGFLYDHGSYTTIDVPDSIYVEPTGISDGGEIVGRYILAVGSSAVEHGFIDIGGNDILALLLSVGGPRQCRRTVLRCLSCLLLEQPRILQKGAPLAVIFEPLAACSVGL